MKSSQFFNGSQVGRRRERLAIVSLVLVAAACGGDKLTRPDPIPPDAPGPIAPAPSANLGRLVIRVATGGTELDTSGYVLGVTGADGFRSRQLSATDSLTLDGISVGSVTVGLTEVAPNCWVSPNRELADSIRANRTTTITFAVSCEAASGVFVNPGAFVGVWEARSWGFFKNQELTSLFEDVIAGGMAGTLTVTNDGGTEIQWHWRETYRWWGPDRPTLIWGHAEIGIDGYGRSQADAMLARADSGKTEFECDWGDCDNGPLNGDYRFVLTAARLVITRVFPSRMPYSGARAWQRLVLERVQ